VKNFEGKSKREAEKILVSMSSFAETHRPDQVRSLTETPSLLSFVVSDETVKDLE
jgi:hypothetical protein